MFMNFVSNLVRAFFPLIKKELVYSTKKQLVKILLKGLEAHNHSACQQRKIGCFIECEIV